MKMKLNAKARNIFFLLKLYKMIGIRKTIDDWEMEIKLKKK